MHHIIWLFALVYFIGIWIAIARETRLCIAGYVLQTSAVAALYLIGAIHINSADVWAGFCGIVIIRLLLIPWLLRRWLSHDLLMRRELEYTITPAFAVGLYVLLGLVGFGVFDSVGGAGGADIGFSIAALLTGIAMTAICLHTPKQILGLLSADNGVDLAVTVTLARVSVWADYAIFVDVAIAVALLAMLLLRLQADGRSNTRDLNELRG